MKRWKIAIPVLVIAFFIAWYAFRPERLIANHCVNEAFTVANGGSPAQALEAGRFHGVLHEAMALSRNA